MLSCDLVMTANVVSDDKPALVVQRAVVKAVVTVYPFQPRRCKPGRINIQIFISSLQKNSFEKPRTLAL